MFETKGSGYFDIGGSVRSRGGLGFRIANRARFLRRRLGLNRVPLTPWSTADLRPSARLCRKCRWLDALHELRCYEALLLMHHASASDQLEQYLGNLKGTKSRREPSEKRPPRNTKPEGC